MLQRTTLSFLLACASAAAQSALAQNTQPTDDAQTDLQTEQLGSSQSAPNPYRPKINFRVGSTTVLPTDVGSTPGDLTTQRLEFGVDVGIPLSEATRLSFTARHQSSFYNFDGTTGLTPFDSDPVGHVAETEFGVRVDSQINEGLALLAGANVTSSGEIGAEFNDTLTAGALAGVKFKISDRYSIGGGLIIASQLEDNAIIIPFPITEYRVNDRLTIGTLGRGFGLKYIANDSVTARSSIVFEFHEYRLDGGAGALNDGTFQDLALNIGGGLDWKPEERVTVSFDAGLLAYREIEFKNSGGGRIARHDAFPGVSFGLTVRAAF